MSEHRPALTAEEWATGTTPLPSIDRGVRFQINMKGVTVEGHQYDPENARALAAALLQKAANGESLFTHADVGDLLDEAADFDVDEAGVDFDRLDRLRSLAVRLASLLPPAPIPEAREGE